MKSLNPFPKRREVKKKNMEIQKDYQGKWLRPTNGGFIVNASAKEDVDKVLVLQAYVPLTELNDEWEEITQEEAERIRKAKDAAKGSVEYPEEKVNQMIGLFATSINKMELTDEQSLQFKDLYPEWATFINKKLEVGFKVLYEDKLYKVKQTIEKVLENQPPSVETAALYEEINETNAGTLEDPIPYNNNMELFEGKYYSQNGVIYKCTRNTEQAVYQDLSALVGLYVEVAE